MAIIKTTQHGRNTCPQATFEVTTKSSTGGAVTYSWVLKWVTYGYTVTSSASKAYTAKIDGATVASGSFAIGGKTTTTIASGEYTINKGTSKRSVPIYLSFAMTFTWNSTAGGTKTASGSFDIAAKDSYTVSYNVNGGSGSFANQTKWWGTNLTLHSGSPSRAGHNFVRWNTNTSNTGTGYAPGATYTGNAALALYAIWTPHTYTVSYNANGGSGAPGNQTKTYGTNLTLSSTRPTRANYNFLGWATSASGGVAYNPGSTYTSNSAITLYAVWQLAYWKPSISNFNAYRCDSSGNASETGTYIKVTFKWATYHTVSEIWIDWSTSPSFSSFSNAQVSASGTSNTATAVVGGGNISIEQSYYVRAYVSDSGGGNHSSIASIGTVKFPIDVKSGGKGVAIGKVAETDNLFDVGLPTKLNGGVNGDIIMNTGHGAKVYWREGSFGDQFAIVPDFSNTGDNNKLKIMGAVGDINTKPDLYNLFTISGQSGNAWFKGSISEGGTSLSSKYLKKDGSSSYVQLTCGDSNNTTGYRIVIQQTFSAWWNARIVMAVNSRHHGCGLLCIGLSIHGTIDSYILDARYYGSNCQTSTAHWLPYYNPSTGVFTLLWNYYDYSPCRITVLERDTFNAPSNGTWSTSLGSYGNLSPVKTAFAPVGSVVITSTNTNPNKDYGGTWELIDKEFAPGDNIGGWSHNTTNCSASDYDFSRAGHTLFFSGGVTSAIQWNDDDVHVGTVNFSSCGVSRIGSDCWFVGYTDAGNSGLMMKLKYDNGQLIIHDNFGDSYISAGRVCKWSCTVTVPMAYMLDAACNKFYWKRTA